MAGLLLAARWTRPLPAKRGVCKVTAGWDGAKVMVSPSGGFGPRSKPPYLFSAKRGPGTFASLPSGPRGDRIGPYPRGRRVQWPGAAEAGAGDDPGEAVRGGGV